jgi:hypothetical protein
MGLRKPLVNGLLCVALLGLLSGLTGCGERIIPRGSENLLVVNFQEGKTLRYQMKSVREVTIELTSSKSGGKQAQPQKMTETLEMVMAYKPVKVDPFGLTKLECVCESAAVHRGSFTGKGGVAGDAVENLKGKLFVLELSPTGKIQDFSQLEALLLEVGKTAFDTTRKDQNIKNPDMIYDFVAMQWYLWDSISSVKDPLDGVKPGMKWTNTQVVAWPIPIPNTPCRVTTYTLDSTQQQEDVVKAIIKSTYQLSDKTLEEFPKPYEGMFQMRGLFGFLRDYQFKSLEGTGEVMFNLSTGTVESDKQQYKVVAGAAFLLPLGDSQPSVVVDQTIDIQLLEDKS